MRFLLVVKEAADARMISMLEEALAPFGNLNVTKAEDMIEHIREQYGIVMVDATGLKDVEGLVSDLRTQRPDIRIVVLTASPTWKRARAAFQAGAIDYLPKTLSKEELQEHCEKLLSKPIPPWPMS